MAKRSHHTTNFDRRRMCALCVVLCVFLAGYWYALAMGIVWLPRKNDASESAFIIRSALLAICAGTTCLGLLWLAGKIVASVARERASRLRFRQPMVGDNELRQPFQFSLRALVIGGPIMGSMIGLVISMSRDPLRDLLDTGVSGCLAVGCLLASFYFAATHSRSTTAWCLIALAWNLVSFNAVHDIIYRFQYFGNTFSPVEAFEPRFPYWFMSQLAVLSVMTFPVAALLTNGRHEPLVRAVKWLLVVSMLPIVDVILLWLTIGDVLRNAYAQ